MKRTNNIVMFFHVFVGIGALFGGIFAMTNPSGVEFGMPANEFLKNSPFKDFFIPGIFLFSAIGLGNIAGFVFQRKTKGRDFVSVVLGFVLCMWIVIQCYILSSVVSLHVIFFIIGVIQISLPIYNIIKIKNA